MVAYAVFHTTNTAVFNIGIFPWFTFFASLLFLSPDWPLKVRDKFSRRKITGVSEDDQFTSIPIQPVLGNTINEQSRGVKANRIFIVTAMTIWLSSQIIIPARNYFYPGNVAWTEDGHRFSWRMKLRSKSGSALFHVRTADKAWTVDPREYLNAKQLRKMPCIPDMVWQFGKFLEDEWTKKGFTDTSVTVESQCSLNGRNRQTFFKPDLDLTSVSRDELAVNWLEPLHEPLKNPLWKF